MQPALNRAEHSMGISYDAILVSTVAGMTEGCPGRGGVFLLMTD